MTGRPGRPPEDEVTRRQADAHNPATEGDLNLTRNRAEWARRNIGPETAKRLEQDEAYFLRQALSTPCLNVLSRCEGIYIQDLQGRRYMDFHGNSVHQVGFGNRRVIQAIKAQLDELSFCTRRYTNEPAIRLARKLAEITPGDLGKSLFCPSGAAAMGMALRLARAATGRFKTISMWDAFHGASLDTASIGGQKMFREDIGPLLPGTEHVPPPDPYRCLWGCGGQCDLRCARYIEYVLEQEGDVAAVIAEPVRSSAVIPRADYWRTVREACDRHGALLIFDEIPHGLGRTGRMFACEHFGVVPDILVLGKGLGGGVLPLAAIVARPALDVMAEKALGHYTHEKNPVLCAAALAAIECIQSDGLVEHARALGEQALGRAQQMQARHPLIGDVRGLGLLLAIELVRDRTTKERATQEAEQVMYLALERGLSFKVTAGNILSLLPPLTIIWQELEEALRIVDECLSCLGTEPRAAGTAAKH
jgi:4-aminobutyrate aminotransferase